MNNISKCTIDLTKCYLAPSSKQAVCVDIHATCKGDLHDKIISILADAQDIQHLDPEYQSLVSQVLTTLAGDCASKVERVIFNPPATILFWDDGEKTVVKCRECGDGECIYDKDFEMPLQEGDTPTVMLDDLSLIDETVSKIARCAFCQTHFDQEKAVMAAMLKRLYPNFQNVLRDALEDGDE